MKTPKVVRRSIVLALVFIALIAQIPRAGDYPPPLDRMKELAVTQGKKDDDGCYSWDLEIEGVEFWVAYCLSDGSVAFGKGIPSGSYRWGIACGPQEDYVFLEAVMGQVVSVASVESEGALEAANDFFKELQTLIENPILSPPEGKQVIV